MAIPGLFDYNQVGRAQLVSFRFGDGVKPVRRKKRNTDLKHNPAEVSTAGHLCWVMLFIKEE
jgi:hypothetical protein